MSLFLEYVLIDLEYIISVQMGVTEIRPTHGVKALACWVKISADNILKYFSYVY